MSGTRSPSKTAPATEGRSLLIAAHGETGGAADNAALLRLTDAVRAKLPGWRVEAGVLNGAPRVEEAFGRLPGAHVTVYPLFMSDGYYVRQQLPQRLGMDEAGRTEDGRQVSILPALGTSPALVRIVARRVAAILDCSGRSAAEQDLLVIAHGSSKSDRPRLDTERFAAALRRRLPTATLRAAYLEEPPFADAAVKQLSESSVVVSFFAGEGAHSGSDLPALMKNAGLQHVPVVGPVGADPQVARLVAAAARSGLDLRSSQASRESGLLPWRDGRLPTADR
jgi:sirohydrochlorin cobaltochelatase